MMDGLDDSSDLGAVYSISEDTSTSGQYGNFSNSSLFGNDSFDSNNSITVPRELPHSLWLTIILGTAASIVIIVTVLGNILVLLSFFLERTIRQPTNYFIASLAMSDLLIGTFSMPCFTLYLLLGVWPLGEIICDLWLSLDWTICLASQYTVFFITADRFCSVKIPAKYRNWRTDRKVRVMIALSWIIPSAVFFTSIIGWQYFEGERKVSPDECEVQFMNDPTFTFLLTIGYFWTTLIVMIVLYVGIYKVALKLQRKSNEKHKKMQNAMDLAKGKTQKNKSKGKNGKKKHENNNAKNRREGNDYTITTSFSKHSDNENSRPSEEDRSSSPAFASDDDENYSDVKVEKKTQCYVNSAVQTERTLKGLLGSSANHMSKLAFSLSGTSVSASQASQSSAERDSSEEQHGHHHPTETDQQKPLLPGTPANKFRPISDQIEIIEDDNDNEHIHINETDNLNHTGTLFLDGEVLEGIRYIDEDSLKSLTSADNVKLLAEIKEFSVHQMKNQNPDSPVWRKRTAEEEKSLLVPHSGDSGASSEALSAGMDAGDAHGSQDIHCNNRPSNNNSVRGRHKKHDKKKHNLDVPNSNENNKKSKHKRTYGSPLQSLVRSLRPSNSNSKEKATKSKSENRARKALRTISIILGAYVLCWTPYHIMVFIIGVCKSWDCINIQFYYFTYWLCYLNSPINPFCYALANAQFKRTFIRIMKLDFHRT